MGCEMLYILQQRLGAQSVDAARSRRGATALLRCRGACLCAGRCSGVRGLPPGVFCRLGLHWCPVCLSFIVAAHTLSPAPLSPCRCGAFLHHPPPPGQCSPLSSMRWLIVQSYGSLKRQTCLPTLTRSGRCFTTWSTSPPSAYPMRPWTRYLSTHRGGRWPCAIDDTVDDALCACGWVSEASDTCCEILSRRGARHPLSLLCVSLPVGVSRRVRRTS